MTLFYTLPLPIRLIDCPTLVRALQTVEELSPRDYAANDNQLPDDGWPNKLLLLTDEPCGAKYSTEGYHR